MLMFLALESIFLSEGGVIALFCLENQVSRPRITWQTWKD